VDPSNPSEEDAPGWRRSIGPGSISFDAVSQFLFAGKIIVMTLEY